MGGKDDGVKVFSAAKYGSVKVFILVQERRASRSPSWRRSAAKDGKVTLTLGVYRSAARSRGAEGAERFRASEARRGLQLGDGREGASARGREARKGRAAPKTLNDSARSATRSAAR